MSICSLWCDFQVFGTISYTVSFLPTPVTMTKMLFTPSQWLGHASKHARLIIVDMVLSIIPQKADFPGLGPTTSSDTPLWAFCLKSEGSQFNMTAPFLTLQRNLWLLCLVFCVASKYCAKTTCAYVVFCAFNPKTFMKYAVLHKVTGRCGFATLPTSIHLSVFFKWDSVGSSVTSSLAPTPGVNGTHRGTLTISVAHNSVSWFTIPLPLIAKCYSQSFQLLQVLEGSSFNGGDFILH